MRDDDTGLIVLGIGALLLMTGKKQIPPSELPWGEGWHWPIPDLIIGDDHYPAVISQEFHAPAHYGVDLMYKRKSLTDHVTDVPAGKGGTTAFWAPDGVHVVAAHDARVWSVDKGPRGISVVLDHGNPWATFYTHLSSTPLAPHQSGFPGGDKTKPQTVVKAGDVIGIMGIDPMDAGKVRHLHFVPWYKGYGDSAAVDPGAQMMLHWERSEQSL